MARRQYCNERAQVLAATMVDAAERLGGIIGRMAIVRLRGQLEKVGGGGSELQIGGDTVTEVLQELERDQGALEGWILDERGEIRQHINVFGNGEQAQPEASVGDADRVEILPAISGG